MQRHEALERRLATQRLSSAPLEMATDVVRLLTCVQSQERDHALWSLGVRSRVKTLAAVRAELDSGAFVRTHILRQTWHFVASEDLRWILTLTSPRVEAKERAHVRAFVPEPRDLDRALETIVQALDGRNLLTRKEIGERLGAVGLPGSGEAVGHLIMMAELRGLVCGGPLAGVNHTYGLVDDLVPSAPGTDREFDREAALAELAVRFFSGHGPAALKDLTRWATMTVADAKLAVAGAGDRLAQVEVDGLAHWMAPDSPSEASAGRQEQALLLPVYDEAVLTYPTVNFPAAQGAPRLPGAEQWWGWVVLDATQVGLWKRTVARGRVTVETRLAPALGRADRVRVDEAVDRMAAFIGGPADHLAN